MLASSFYYFIIFTSFFNLQYISILVLIAKYGQLNASYKISGAKITKKDKRTKQRE
jgi:hypothetical protein